VSWFWRGYYALGSDEELGGVEDFHLIVGFGFHFFLCD
jgi:hypothetical protein